MPVDFPDDGLLLRGFGLAGYRSIRDLQFIGPMRKITILAGPNNAGKSNVLRFLRDHFSTTVTDLSRNPSGAFAWADGDDAPLGPGGEAAAFAVCRSLRDEEVVNWSRTLTSGRKSLDEEGARGLLESIAGSQASVNGALWRVWRRRQRNTVPEDNELIDLLSEAYKRDRRLQDLAEYLSGQPPQVIKSALEPTIPKAFSADPVFIPAFRQIRSSSSTAWDGEGLIPLLADLRDPDLGPERSAKQKRWHAFETFVRTVLQRPDADLRVPANKERLIVTMDGRSLDVEDLGTGIHEVVILAAAATAHDRTLFLVEEPEIHAHPVIQRRLMSYLASATTNQYVIATHSAQLLDFERASVFRVYLDEGWTVVQGIDTNTARVDAARELGYRPSDLLQADSVIWVEGPSDRIYLNYWIHSLDPSLVEGVHYSVMFYGGRLASHLTGKDTPFGLGAGELIELRRLNRRSALIMDSDRTRKGEAIRGDSTKGRLRSEFEADGIAWLTQGREIENYIAPDVILQAIRRLDAKAAKLIDDSDYSHRWRYRRKGSSRHYEADKMDLARAVVELGPTLDALDLRKRVAEIVEMIRASGPEPSHG
jgi:hypothetical protein